MLTAIVWAGVLLAVAIVAYSAWVVWRELHPRYPAWPRSVVDLPTRLRDADDHLGEC